MISLGLDVSSTSTGAVALGPTPYEEAQLWCPDPNKKLGMDPTDRGIWMGGRLATMLENAKPDIVMMEQYGFASNSLVPQAEVKGLLKMVLRQMDYSWVMVAPNALKKFVGSKQKEDIKLMTFKLWGFEHKSNDVVDAYVLSRIGLCLLGSVDPVGVAQKEVIASLQDKV